MAVDPASDTQASLEVASRDDMTISGMLITHYVASHVGDALWDSKCQGAIVELLGQANTKSMA